MWLFTFFFARAIETCISCMSLKTTMLALLIVLLMASNIACSSSLKKAQPPPDWLPTVGGDRQMISVQQAPPPLVPPRREGQLDCTQQISHVTISWSRNYIIALIWFDSKQEECKDNYQSFFFCYCLFVCLQRLSFFFVNDCSCSFSFWLFFSFQRLSVCACVCKKLQLCLTMGGLISPCNKMVVLYVAYWQKN